MKAIDDTYHENQNIQLSEDIPLNDIIYKKSPCFYCNNQIELFKICSTWKKKICNECIDNHNKNCIEKIVKNEIKKNEQEIELKKTNNLSSKIEEKTNRNFGIDLIRIISMYNVVILHVNNFGEILFGTKKFSSNYYTVWFLETISMSSVNVFGLISRYVMIDSSIIFLKLFFSG